MTTARPNLRVFAWQGAVSGEREWVDADAPRRVFTVARLHLALGKLMEQRPHLADLPVHVLDMEPDDGTGNESIYSGLVTDIETDCFDGEQGLVCSLISWPNQTSRDNAQIDDGSGALEGGA